MLTTSYRTRGAVFAFLIGPPRRLQRQEGTAIHNEVCERLGSDDVSFKYESPPAGGQGFGIHMERKRAREDLKVIIDHPGPPAPVRMVTEFSWPASWTAMLQDLDLVAEGVFAALGDGWQRVLAEARVRGQTDSKGGAATAFLTRDVLRLSENEIASVGSTGISFASFKYEVEAGPFDSSQSLANPKREVSLEVLREDPKCLYVEVMSQWPQVAFAGPPRPGAIQIDPSNIRSFGSNPSAYLEETKGYLESVVLPLFER